MLSGNTGRGGLRERKLALAGRPSRGDTRKPGQPVRRPAAARWERASRCNLYLHSNYVIAVVVLLFIVAAAASARCDQRRPAA